MSGELCPDCSARRWLIGELSPLLDYQRSRPERLMDLLALPSADLIEAIGGRRRAVLKARLQEPPTGEDLPSGAWELCRHSRDYPRRASSLPEAPPLSLRGKREDTGRMLQAPAVALVGSRTPSGYGVQMAASLARGLAAAGVCVVASMDATVGRAALAGALQSGGKAIGVMPHGLAVRSSGQTRQLQEELLAGAGCMLSEQPAGARGRSWEALAAERLTVALSDLVVLVEAREQTSEMLPARLAGRLGRRLGAVPGMLTNPLASGPHALLSTGASLVRDAADVLDVLHLDPPAQAHTATSAALRSELEILLAKVGAGEGTIEELTGEGRTAARVLAGLGELEALGLVTRLADGRYQATQPVLPPRRRADGRRGGLSAE